MHCWLPWSIWLGCLQSCVSCWVHRWVCPYVQCIFVCNVECIGLFDITHDLVSNVECIVLCLIVCTVVCIIVGLLYGFDYLTNLLLDCWCLHPIIWLGGEQRWVRCSVHHCVYCCAHYWVHSTIGQFDNSTFGLFDYCWVHSTIWLGGEQGQAACVLGQRGAISGRQLPTRHQCLPCSRWSSASSASASSASASSSSMPTYVVCNDRSSASLASASTSASSSMPPLFEMIISISSISRAPVRPYACEEFSLLEFSDYSKPNVLSKVSFLIFQFLFQMK